MGASKGVVINYRGGGEGGGGRGEGGGGNHGSETLCVPPPQDRVKLLFPPSKGWKPFTPPHQYG